MDQESKGRTFNSHRRGERAGGLIITVRPGEAIKLEMPDGNVAELIYWATKGRLVRLCFRDFKNVGIHRPLGKGKQNESDL